ncbi:MAG: DUF234 domain-containing protein, partial [Propionibacteriaceae bacterium]|nr:DUF234 domain-containing protein [Propionibacteriaceae bacterium]
SLIGRAAGGGQALPSGSLIPVLATLAGRRVVTDELPLSTVADTRNRRYRVADSYLRFWLAFGARIVPLAERGLGGTAVARVEAGWLSWRGRAVEPLVRESLTRLLARESADRVVGGWWNRLNNPEVDLVGADRGPVARRIEFVGSVKWRDSQPFDGHDLAELARGARAVPGAERADLVAVSASGFADGLALARRWGPADLLDAWR